MRLRLLECAEPTYDAWHLSATVALPATLFRDIFEWRRAVSSIVEECSAHIVR